MLIAPYERRKKGTAEKYKIMNFMVHTFHLTFLG
jgi:hypothetical protein